MTTNLAPNVADFHLNLAIAYKAAGNHVLAAKELATEAEIEKKQSEWLDAEVKRKTEQAEEK